MPDDGQPLIERKPHGAAVILRRLADQIDLNDPASFGGVAVIVPPQDAGEPIEVLILDPKKNAAQFYATIKTRLEGQLSDLEVLQRQQQAGFGRR
jgi:hypothetical protein